VSSALLTPGAIVHSRRPGRHGVRQHAVGEAARGLVDDDQIYGPTGRRFQIGDDAPHFERGEFGAGLEPDRDVDVTMGVGRSARGCDLESTQPQWPCETSGSPEFPGFPTWSVRSASSTAGVDET